MAHPKGTIIGGGSRKGIPNKATADVKAMILQALSDAGGAEYLKEQSGKNPAAFMTLVGKVLPLQVTGSDGGPIQYQVVTGVVRAADGE